MSRFSFLLITFIIFNNFVACKSISKEIEKLGPDIRSFLNNFDTFFKKINFFENVCSINLQGKKFKIFSSNRNLFADTYFDNDRLTLNKLNASLRHRTRFKNTQLVSKLILVKTKSISEKNAFTKKKFELQKLEMEFENA